MFKKELSSEGGTQETIIAQGVKVEGEFVCQGNITVQGEVHGTVRTERDLNVGEQAKIVANVWAQNAVIAGEVQGNMKISERLELTPTSRVAGDLEAKIISMSPGAVLNGRCAMPGGAEETASNPALFERKRNGRVKISSPVESEEPQLS